MIPAAFGYRRPATVDEALKAISGGDGSVKVLAGGQSLLPLLKLRLGRADMLVDIGRLDELKGVRQLPDGRLAVGALTTYADLMESPAKHYGLLGDAIPGIGPARVEQLRLAGVAVGPGRDPVDQRE